MVNSAAEAYKKQQIMTATPEALTLMLYNGCYQGGCRRARRKEL